jgi:hypothetical protein
LITSGCFVHAEAAYEVQGEEAVLWLPLGNVRDGSRAAMGATLFRASYVTGSGDAELTCVIVTLL